jgi:hypothetical protein
LRRGVTCWRAASQIKARTERSEKIRAEVIHDIHLFAEAVQAFQRSFLVESSSLVVKSEVHNSFFSPLEALFNSGHCVLDDQEGSLKRIIPLPVVWIVRG